MIHNNRPV